MFLIKQRSLFTKPLLSSFFPSQISTQLIKSSLNPLQQPSQKYPHTYPKTFQQKQLYLNNPKTIQFLQIIQYGIKYKKSKYPLSIVLTLIAVSCFLLNKYLPIRVYDRYFNISPESLEYISGYVFAGFNYQKPFYLYLPVMFAINHFTRFISFRAIAIIIFINCLVGSIIGQYLVNNRVSKYEVWQNQHIRFGEGNALSILFAFWSYLGLKQAFTHIKSRLFIKSQRGIGIIRKGIPFGYICLFYLVLQLIFYKTGTKNSQIVFTQILMGIIMGIILKRINPIIK